MWVNSSTLAHDFHATYKVYFSAEWRLVAFADANLSNAPGMRYVLCADGGDSFLSIEEAAGGGGATCAKYPMASSAMPGCAGAGCFECVNQMGVVAQPEQSGLAPPMEAGATFIGKDTFDGHDVDVYQKVVVIHTHGTNVTLDLRWRLASGSDQLLEWSEAQRQVEAASGKVLQSHNESHAFRRYSPTPDAAAFGPPAGVACE